MSAPDPVSHALDRLTNRVAELEFAARVFLDAYDSLDNWQEAVDISESVEALRVVMDG